MGPEKHLKHTESGRSLIHQFIRKNRILSVLRFLKLRTQEDSGQCLCLQLRKAQGSKPVRVLDLRFLIRQSRPDSGLGLSHFSGKGLSNIVG